MSQHSIFISYRRDDSAGYAEHLYADLSRHFPSEEIFMDLDHLEPGDNFPKVIEEAVASCSVLLALIGREWLTVKAGGRLRLSNEEDFVRLEIAAALCRNIRVIPILVHGASMPRRKDLPEDLAPLADRQAQELGEGRRRAPDVDRLIHSMKRHFELQDQKRRIEQEAAEEAAKKAKANAEAEQRRRRELDKKKVEEIARATRISRERIRRQRSAKKWREPEPVQGPTVEVQRKPEASPLETAAIEPAPVPGPVEQVTEAQRQIMIANDATLAAEALQPCELPDSQVQASRRPTVTRVIEVLRSSAAVLWPKPSAEKHLELPEADKEPASFYNRYGMEMIRVPAGVFMMGSEDRNANERPVHEVTISRPFYAGKYEVTQGDWRALMGTTVQGQELKANQSWPLPGEGYRYPMYYVSWDDAQEFIQKLNELDDGYLYRLPTEAEWEYAARGGTSGDYAGSLEAMAWDGNNSGQQTHPVGTKQPNGFGLYDMHGNVWEWCQDFYDENYYAESPGTDPQGPGTGHNRVLRGGSWFVDGSLLRSAYRVSNAPDTRNDVNGFRVVAVPRT